MKNQSYTQPGKLDSSMKFFLIFHYSQTIPWFDHCLTYWILSLACLFFQKSVYVRNLKHHFIAVWLEVQQLLLYFKVTLFSCFILSKIFWRERLRRSMVNHNPNDIGYFIVGFDGSMSFGWWITIQTTSNHQSQQWNTRGWHAIDEKYGFEDNR